MAEASLLTDDLKRLIGMCSEPVIYKVEEGAIKRYAEAMLDPNPLYNDSGYANNSKYGGLICPPGFMGWPVKGKEVSSQMSAALAKAGVPPRFLAGGEEFEFYLPIRAGDTLVATGKIHSMVERETSRGPMLFTTLEEVYLNMDGDVAVIARHTVINY